MNAWYTRLRGCDATWWFLRALGVTYIIAFGSAAVQIQGLAGAHGILPVSVFLARAAEALGSSAWTSVPTVFWLRSNDAALTAVCVAGCAAGVMVASGVLWRLGAIAGFVLYLSIISGCQDFLAFQWDFLLLEAGFLAMFAGLSGIVVWLYRWLLFRLMFLSGCVKLLSGDATWRNLTAMTFHYQTQPIPNVIAWYAHQLPVWFQKMSTASVLAIEVVIPFIIFAPARLRSVAAWSFLALQVLISLTGNYAFFNLLAMALCLFLFGQAPKFRWPERRWREAIAILLAVFIGSVSTVEMLGTLGVRAPGQGLVSALAPFGVVNTYGLFAVMTTRRPEIVVEGSDDGVTWRAYEFRYKPGRLDRHPPFVAPHQPRLDWQMWFAALGDYRQNPWFVNFMLRLLQGSPEVLGLLETNPFPDHPPKFVRAMLFDYTFTDFGERRATGNWWKRTAAGTYLRAVSLVDFTAPSR